MYNITIPEKSTAALIFENVIKHSKPSKIRRIFQRALRIYNILRYKEAYEDQLEKMHTNIDCAEKINWLIEQISICDNNLQICMT